MGGERTSTTATCDGAHVRVEEKGGALVVSLQRPPLNVLDLEAIRSLHAALAPLPARRDLKVLVVRSGLDRVFSAGVDVRDHSRERAPEMLDAFHAVPGRGAQGLAAGRGRLRPGAGGNRAHLPREDLLPSEDVEEGIRAFLENRPPRWRDG
jgi:enoyl-CoA hydratase/carnithine racemase